MDHYTTLGVAKNATPDEIKKAYRKLASQHHPDKGGNTTKFQEIQTAYDTLSDQNKRFQYDNQRPTNFNGFHHGQGNPDLEEILRNFGLGDMFRNVHQQRNNIFRTKMDITLKESYTGCVKNISVGTNNGTHSISINVPKGIDSTQQVRYENILPNSTLIVDYHILPDLKYERRGNDLLANQQISVLDLIVGTKFEFETISGTRVEVNVKPGTQPFMQLKLPTFGMPILNSHMYGDQIILIKPFIPATISQEIIDAIIKNK